MISSHRLQLKSKRIPPQNYDIEIASTRNTEMHRVVVTRGCGNRLPVLHIDWTTIQFKEFAEKTVIMRSGNKFAIRMECA